MLAAGNWIAYECGWKDAYIPRAMKHVMTTRKLASMSLIEDSYEVCILATGLGADSVESFAAAGRQVGHKTSRRVVRDFVALRETGSCLILHGQRAVGKSWLLKDVSSDVRRRAGHQADLFGRSFGWHTISIRPALHLLLYLV